MHYRQQLEPLTASNLQLQSEVHPLDWHNPKPSGRYNLVVIGAGTAGLVTAAGAAGLGAKVALVERGLMGGDCLNVGCVPSKAILAAARRAVAARPSNVAQGDNESGVRPTGAEIDFAQVMENMRRKRASISANDSARRFAALGVDVYFGQGMFTGRSSIEVGGQTLEFHRAVIATGARATDLGLPGLRNEDILTNETLFSLTSLPKRLTIIGGGPIGCEMAQAFARLGSQVTLIDRNSCLLTHEDVDAAQVVQDALISDGVRLLTDSTPIRGESSEEGKTVVVRREGQEIRVAGDAILVGVGRTPNVQEMGLEVAGVRFDLKRGVEVDDRLRTSNSAIYAAGDVCSKFKFTHSADFHARTAIRNSLFLGRQRVSQLIIPWCTYTSPELAHVGLTPQAADEQKIKLSTYTQSMSEVDRAVLENEEVGFVRIHCRQGTDRIVGATIVAKHAGEMISEVVLAMTQTIGLSQIAATIHPYPTRSEALRKIGDQYNRTRLTPLVKKLAAMWLRWTR